MRDLLCLVSGKPRQTVNRYLTHLVNSTPYAHAISNAGTLIMETILQEEVVRIQQVMIMLSPCVASSSLYLSLQQPEGLVGWVATNGNLSQRASEKLTLRKGGRLLTHEEVRGLI